MKCEEFLRLLDNGGPVREDEAGEHMKDCSSCRAALEKWEAAAVGLGAMKDEEAPPFLHARIMAHVREEADAEPRPSGLALWVHSRWAAPVGLMIVAAAIGGIALVTSFNRTVDRQPPLPAPQAQAPVKASEGRLAARKAPASESAKKVQGELTPPPVDRLSRPPAATTPKASAPETRFYADAPPPRADQSPATAGNETQMDAQAERAEPLFGSSSQAAPDQVVPQPSPAPQQPPPDVAKRNAVRAPHSAPTSALKEKAEESPRPTMVLCLLSTLDHARFASLQLPSNAVPPPGEKWYVSILDDGGMTLTDMQGKPLGRRVSTAVTGYVSMLNLPAGRYRLTQVGS
jgi:hypothetical protein